MSQTPTMRFIPYASQMKRAYDGAFYLNGRCIIEARGILVVYIVDKYDLKLLLYQW